MEPGKGLGGLDPQMVGSKSSAALLKANLTVRSMDHDINPFRNWATVVDCGDIANTPFDKLVAIHELERGMKAINDQKPKNISVSEAVRLITIGGDHTISMFPAIFWPPHLLT